MRKLYTKEEAAYIIGVNPGTIRKWVREGLLKGEYVTKLGNDDHEHLHLMIEEEELLSASAKFTEHRLKWVNQSAKRRDHEAYLEMLVRQDEELWQQISFIEQMNNYVRKMEF